MKTYIKSLLMSVFTIALVLLTSNVQAASASITANKTAVTVGDSVVVTLNIDAATWSAYISGDVTDTVVAYNLQGQNEKTTKSYTINTTKTGTYTVKLSGDVTDGNTDVTTDLNQTITITVKEKPVAPPPPPPSSGGTSSGNSGTVTPAKSSDATLKALRLEVEGLSPSFNKNTTVYTLSVGSEINTLKVNASPTHSKAKCSVSGNTNLQYGDNTISITVTAENGAKKTYKIIVTKAENPEKSNAYLTNLIIENMALKEEFAKEVLEYSVDNVPADMQSLPISAFPENTKATVVVSGNENLKEGENTIKILVTAEDGKTTKEYAIKVTKEKAIAVGSNNVIEDSNNLVKSPNKEENGILNIIKNKQEYQLLILVYILSVVEFVEILYLFFQLRGKEKETEVLSGFDDKKSSRRGDKRVEVNTENSVQDTNEKENNI